MKSNDQKKKFRLPKKIRSPRSALDDHSRSRFLRMGFLRTLSECLFFFGIYSFHFGGLGRPLSSNFWRRWRHPFHFFKKKKKKKKKKTTQFKWRNDVPLAVLCVVLFDDFKICYSKFTMFRRARFVSRKMEIRGEGFSFNPPPPPHGRPFPSIELLSEC